jgi:hypothetical protein
MEKLSWLRAEFLLIGAILVIVEVVQARRKQALAQIASWTLGGLAIVSLLFYVFLWSNHLGFPLNLDLMEGTILQHFQRAVAFQPIYPEPTPEYVPLAYNVFYYIFSIPLAWLLGANLTTLRLVSILGIIGSGAILYLVVQQYTKSFWWGLITVGLFSAAYGVMDVYLDTAHADSWLICTLLGGSYLIDRDRSRLWNCLGIVVLVSSFWFKQHGALFAIGGLLFLTWREGMKASLLYWLTSIVLGPVLYLFAGPYLFGSQFHYFTWQVPRQWSELTLGNFRRFLVLIKNSYPVLALSGAVLVAWTGLRNRLHLRIWHVQFVFAALSGFMGTLDHGSSNNVFIPMGTLFILVGVLGLYTLSTRFKTAQRYRLHLLALFISFTAFLYNPLNAIASPLAAASYMDLVNFLNGLQGNVYAPSLGQLQNGYRLQPAAHWVALEDMVRGPGLEIRNQPKIRQLLDELIHPQKPTFILSNVLLSDLTPALQFLGDTYTLEQDLGDRFQPLRALVKLFNHKYPRYLYRYSDQQPANPPPIP